MPIYLTHIAGISVGDSTTQVRGIVMRNALAYVFGFSLVFVALGAALGAAGSVAGSLDFVATNRIWLVRIGGLLLIVLGLHQIDIVRIPFLYRDRHMSLDGAKPGTIGSSFMIGVTFAAGWTPCMTPILGAILTMAAGQGSIDRATTLLIFYALGLAIPFLAAAIAFGSLPRILSRVNKHLHMVTTVSGAVMLGVGFIMILGFYEQLFTEIIRAAPWTPWEPRI